MPKKSTIGMPQVSIAKPAYSMATVDGKSAEIVLYGDIYEQQPTDWYGNPIEGQFITLDEFMRDLERIEGCTDLTIRMNSYGGDAAVSNLIHNRLRDLAHKGTKLTCIVDGVAMSGGSIIMCACDTVKVNPSSLIMIHKCWMYLFGGYNADELREAATSNDAYDKMQIEVYKRKTGLSDTVLSHMMSDTTYMTGREAVAKKFADELIEDAEPLNIAASADGRSVFVRGRQIHLAPGMIVPDTVPTVEPEVAEQAASVVDSTPPEPQSENNEGGHEIMANNFAELLIENPQLAQTVEAEIRASERERIAGIDRIAALYSDEAVNAAKYGEGTRCDAATLALRMAEAQSAEGRQTLKHLNNDANASGANDVPSAAAPTDPTLPAQPTPEQIRAQAKADVLRDMGMDKKED